MGLLDKLKEQALDSINDLSNNLQEKLNGVGNSLKLLFSRKKCKCEIIII